MNSQDLNTALLPSGFEDLLPPQAEAEYAAISSMMAVFRQFGYARVKPPMAEFEESLLGKGPGATLAPETFRVMDTQTHRMMALRSDITAQIARIANTRLVEEARPLRLTYANDVIRTRGSQARTQRQFTQVGCEMIGRDSASSDVEICVIALKALAAVGLKDVSVDFAIPQRVDEIFKLTGKGEDDMDVLRHKLAGDADMALKALKEIGLGDLERLEAVVQGVQDGIEGLGLDRFKVTIDPLETRGFEYHNGLAFTVFAKDIRGELGRGGRYDIEGGEASESAAGFTLYMDSLRQGLKPLDAPEEKRLAEDADWAEIRDLQEQGIITVKG